MTSRNINYPPNLTLDLLKKIPVKINENVTKQYIINRTKITSIVNDQDIKILFNYGLTLNKSNNIISDLQELHYRNPITEKIYRFKIDSSTKIGQFSACEMKATVQPNDDINISLKYGNISMTLPTLYKYDDYTEHHGSRRFLFAGPKDKTTVLVNTKRLYNQNEILMVMNHLISAVKTNLAISLT